ncbi:hypothetical protein LSTR_LSTR004018 [Laodelphax striatellus]|uniref:Uncharacterized protein n=1 Tax=Laodelphax striatellus TaxID=195883 RepID=A0A482WF42_LAOST|nr:hypothetical protein LSTR_LSTR004018 [Laodelphax striatellus]
MLNNMENSGIKSNNEIEWKRMSLLCESFFNVNCVANKKGIGTDESEVSGSCQEKNNLQTESRPCINRKFAESNLNINNESTRFFEKAEGVDYKDAVSTDIIELSLTDSDYLRAKNRWFDFSDTELDFATAERMNYINLLTECFSNRNFGEHYSSHTRKLNSNLAKPLTKDHVNSRLFSKKQDTLRKFEFCVENNEENKSGEGDCDNNNPKTGHSALMASNDCASMKNHVGFDATSTPKNNLPNYQTHPRGDHLVQRHDNYNGNFVANVLRLGVEGTGKPSEKIGIMPQGSPLKIKASTVVLPHKLNAKTVNSKSFNIKANNSSVCCLRSQTENEEIRKRLENLERIMLTNINSCHFDNECESPLLIGEQIGLQSSISTNKVKFPSIEKSEIFPCRKIGLHNRETSRKCENGEKSLERNANCQKVVVDEGGNKIVHDTRTSNRRKPRFSQYKENEVVTESKRRKDLLDELRDSQTSSFADSWSEFEIENIFENNEWLKESSKGSSSSSSKRTYVTSDYTLIRRRKKYHRRNRRGRNRNRKDETLEKCCHETDKRRGAPSEKRQLAKTKAFTMNAGKEKRCCKKEEEEKEEEIPKFQSAKGSRIKQYCVIL